VLELSEYRESHLPSAVHIHLLEWFAAGLPIEGEAAGELCIGQLARGDAPSCSLEDRLGEVRARVESAGRDQAVVLDPWRVLLGLAATR
jgi:hypothetical protein